MTGRWLTVFVLAVGLLCWLSLRAAAQDAGQSAPPPASSGRIIPETRDEIHLSFAPLVKKVAPAVVNIYTSRKVERAVNPFMADPFFRQFFEGAFGDLDLPGGLSRQMVENALGTGVIVDRDGLIVTNAHVAEAGSEIKVVLLDGREFEAEKILVDKASDLAVLRIAAKGAALPYVTLQPSETLEVGDLVLAIGNPFGVGQTVTSGIVSALARSSLDINDFNFFIQTDAAINPGNSGGPLVAMNGGVVGINSAIFSRDGGSLGIGFAIPSEMVATVLAAAKAGQTGDRVVRPWLGVDTQKMTADIAASLGLDAPRGLLVSGLRQASPLRAAGVETGDIILAMDGRALSDPAELKFRMATVPVGGSASFEVNHKGEQRTLKIPAIAPPDKPPREETALSGYTPLAGATVVNVNPAVAVELGLERDAGVAVAKVDPRSQAARAVRPGDVILSVNGDVAADVKTLQRLLNGASAWRIVVDSHGRKRELLFR